MIRPEARARALAALIVGCALASSARAGAQTAVDEQHPARPSNPHPGTAPPPSGTGTTTGNTETPGGDDVGAEAQPGNTEPTGDSTTGMPAGVGAPAGTPAPGGEGDETEAEAEGETTADAAAAQTQRPTNENAVQPLTAEQQALLVPAGGDLPLRDTSRTGRIQRFFFPPFLREWGPDRNTTVVFPFYFENHDRDDHRFLIPPFYRVRTPTVQGDVVFPLYFRFHGRDGDTVYSTDVVTPAWLHTSHGAGRSRALAYGVAPIFSYAEMFNRAGTLEGEHLVIPPLLTFHRWWPTGQTTVVGPVMYFRDHRDITWTAAPFVFHHESPTELWTLVPEALTYIHTDRENNHTTSVVGLYFSDVSPVARSYNFAPIFFHYSDHNGVSRTTFVPLFHSEAGPNRFSFFTLLGGYGRDGAESTLITPLYQNHRGASDLDAVLPFFFYSRTPRQGRTSFGLLPLTFWSGSPTGFSWMAFPFAARFSEFARYDTVASPFFVNANVAETHSNYTWVFPSFHVEQTPDHHAFNFYPFVYSAAGAGWHHNVVAPFVWDVGNRTQGTQITIVAPFFGRVENRDSVTEWVFPNHVYWERRTGERGFGWDFFPFVQYGEPRHGDSYWSVFEGMFGHRRQGSFEQTQVFWIPLGSTRAPGAAGSQQSRSGARAGDVLIDM